MMNPYEIKNIEDYDQLLRIEYELRQSAKKLEEYGRFKESEFSEIIFQKEKI